MRAKKKQEVTGEHSTLTISLSFTGKEVKRFLEDSEQLRTLARIAAMAAENLENEKKRRKRP